MSKAKEELVQLKNEYESLSNKLAELTDEELKFVSGGILPKEHDEQLIQSYKKDIGSDKNAKVIFDL